MEKQILDAVQRALDKLAQTGRSSNALKGDVCCRVVMHFIQNSMGTHIKVAGPNAWVKGFSTEFDMLITKPEACPHEFTAVYEPTDVFACLEVKEHGLFGGRKDLEQATNRKRGQFDEIRSLYPHIQCGYLTLKEVCEPARTGSINYLKKSKEGLAPYPVFCLQDSRTDKIRTGEYERLLIWLDHSFKATQK